MNPELIVVEGASGTGKSTLIREMEERTDCAIVRGMPSQNPKENEVLTHFALEMIRDVSLNLGEALRLPEIQRSHLVTRMMLASTFQMIEARRLKAEGCQVLLDRSPISLTGLMYAVRYIPGFENWALNQADKVRKNLLEGPLFRTVDGIVLMTQPISGVEREGVKALGEMEAVCIKDVTRSFSMVYNIPLLELNASEMSVDEEVDKVKHFMSVI